MWVSPVDEMGEPYGGDLPAPCSGPPTPREGLGKVKRGLSRPVTTSIASRIKGNPNRRGSSGPARTGSFAMLVLLPAYVPFALLIGAAAAARGESLAGWAGSLLIFGGSAQLAAIRVMDRSGPEAAVLTGLLVNAAFSSTARRWPGAGRGNRAGSGSSWPG